MAGANDGKRRRGWDWNFAFGDCAASDNLKNVSHEKSGGRYTPTALALDGINGKGGLFRGSASTCESRVSESRPDNAQNRGSSDNRAGDVAGSPS